MKPRSLHNLSKVALTTFDPGELIPVSCIEVLPGDTIQANTEAVIRALPLLAPVMHQVEILVTHSYTPHRVVWEDFNDFITGGEDGLDASVFPTIDFSGTPVAKGSLANYLGLPVGYNSTASALPFRAYAAFYNAHIRDEEHQAKLTIDLTSGADTTTSVALKNVNWSGDRFTRSNANQQLGVAVTVPISGNAPVHGLYVGTGNTVAIGGEIAVNGAPAGTNSINPAHMLYAASKSAAGTAPATAFNTTNANVYAALASVTGTDINQLREAIALQKFMEMRQIYGSTIEKMSQADFGVSPLDARLQQPEILALGKGMLTFSEVLATAETGATTDVGDMKGHAIAAMRTNKFRHFVPEFGYVMTFVAVRPKAVYSQGVPRHFIKSTKEDFYSPHLENMGMQTILNKEVKYNHSSPNGTFSYEPRFNEYRSEHNTYHGDFVDSSLNYWHFGRDLSGDPALNSTFITCSPTSRVFAQSVTDNLLGMFKNKVAARRLVKKSVKPIGLV